MLYGSVKVYGISFGLNTRVLALGFRVLGVSKVSKTLLTPGSIVGYIHR